MPKAEQSNTTTSDDAELIALCGQFDALHRRIAAVCPKGATPIADNDEREKVTAPLYAEQDHLLDRIRDTRAATLHGIRAKARSLTQWMPDYLAQRPDSIDMELLSSILRDLLAEDAGAWDAARQWPRSAAAFLQEKRNQAVEAEHKAEVAEYKAELEALYKAKEAPGSAEDMEHAKLCWRDLVEAARLVIASAEDAGWGPGGTGRGTGISLAAPEAAGRQCGDMSAPPIFTWAEWDQARRFYEITQARTKHTGGKVDDPGLAVRHPITAIGRRLHAVADQYNEADVRTCTLAECSAEYKACEDEMKRLLAEEIALHDLVLTMQPKTLEDAAVQLGCLFLALSHMTDCETSKDDLERGVRRAKQVAAGLTTVVCRLAGVDPADAGDPDLAGLLKRYGPAPSRIAARSPPRKTQS